MAGRPHGGTPVNASHLIQPWEQVADPLADLTVQAIADSGGSGTSSSLATASRLMAQWTRNGDLAQWNPASSGAESRVVEVLKTYLSEAGKLPPWADPRQIARAEQVFMEHGPLSCTLLFCSSLPACYVLPHLAEVLHIAGQLEAHTEHRIRQTAAMVFPVMMRGGLSSPDGAGVAQVLKVRLIHATIRHLILQGASDTAPNVSDRSQPAPKGLHEALFAHGWDASKPGKPCNQVELAYTLLTFSYSFLQGMRKLGQGLSPEDETAYLHTWNVVGHVLGIHSELMAHTMEEAEALFARIQRLGRQHAVTPDPRPALGRTLMQTMANSIRLPVIRHVPVPLTQWLIGPQAARDIGVTESVSWWTRALFRTGLTVSKCIDTAVRLLIPRFSLSRLFTRIIGYHLLTRFLLDQTRPLNLPEHVLTPMKTCVAAWGEDPHAAPWLNRLEDRFTTSGHWQGTPQSTP